MKIFGFSRDGYPKKCPSIRIPARVSENEVSEGFNLAKKAKRSKNSYKNENQPDSGYSSIEYPQV